MARELATRQPPRPEGGGIHIQQVLGTPRELTTEILRLFVLETYNEDHIATLGIKKEDMAAYLCQILPEPGGALYTADDGHRLKGLLYLAPDLWASALLGHHIWNLQHLIVAPDALGEVAEHLVEYALANLDGHVDFLSARPAASDAAAIRGLRQCGFRVLGGEAVGILSDIDPVPPGLARVSFTPLEASHLKDIESMSSDFSMCNPFAIDPGFDPGRVETYCRRLVSRRLNERLCGTLVAQNDGDGLLGVVGYSLDTGLWEHMRRRVAGLDFIGVASEHCGIGMHSLLIRHMLSRLKEDGIEAVTARTMMTGSEPPAELAALRKVGFRITRTNLIMHRWVGEPR